MQEEEERGMIVWRGLELHQSSVDYCKAWHDVVGYLILPSKQNYGTTTHEIVVRLTIRGT